MTEQIRFRPGQQRVMNYRGGKMGISAVPGSGKTFTLSALAARLLLDGRLDVDQEVLVVTLVNSAVDNFSARIGGFLQKAGLPQGIGYRVRTLHGLANDILRERPESVGLSENFQIVDEGESNRILDEISLAWLRAYPGRIEDYLKPDLEATKTASLRRKELPELVRDLAVAAIRTAKDREWTPSVFKTRLADLPAPLPLAELAAALYEDYQRALAYRGAVDFDDLIRLALSALRVDHTLVERLRNQWPFLLEDESQDSSRLQQLILEELCGPDGNWVRVGDPNQAIYETFTTASPTHLLDFMNRPDVRPEELGESGRSSPRIIALANRIIAWSRSPAAPATLENALSEPFILPAPPGDPQSNPPADDSRIVFHDAKYSPVTEIEKVASSIQGWLADPQHRNQTIAALVPINQHGFKLVEELQKRNIPVVDSLLKSSSSTRTSAGAIKAVLHWMAAPDKSPHLKEAFKAWLRHPEHAVEDHAAVERGEHLLAGLTQVEDYLSPQAGRDWLASPAAQAAPAGAALLAAFRPTVQRWQGAALLPVDQIVLTIAQDLFSAPAELAVAHKMAGLLRRLASDHPDWGLTELAAEVDRIAENQRRLLGFSQEDTAFDPDRYPGQVVVTTVHKAKGLEWDRVYLLSANTFDFPSGSPLDRYRSEKWFVRDSLNLEAETLEQMQALFSDDAYTWYREGEASLRAREEYARERLRLFYVAVTRARRDLIVTWNTGKNGKLGSCLLFRECAEFVKPNGEE